MRKLMPKKKTNRCPWGCSDPYCPVTISNVFGPKVPTGKKGRPKKRKIK